MKPLAPSAAVVILLMLAFDADAQSSLDPADPWDDQTAQKPLDVIDPWDDSSAPMIDPKKEIVPPWPRAKVRPKRELNLVDPWTEYPKRRRPIPRRELSVVDPWEADAPDVPTAAFPLLAEPATTVTPPPPTRPAKPIPTARFPLLTQ
jgi:hypothetical protein